MSSSVRSNVKKSSSTAKGSATASASNKVSSMGASKKDGVSGSSTAGSSKGSKDFAKWIQQCSKVYDYKDDKKDAAGKQERLHAIQELGNLISDQKNIVNHVLPNLSAVMTMIEKNIFRPLPSVKKNTLGFAETGIDAEEEEVDPAWPQLYGIYDLFLQIIISEAVETKALKSYINPQFVQEFLELFDSELSAERDFLKNILHKLYAKLVPRRKMIRKAMNECFYDLIHENHKFNGAAELLDILASIISGFAVPLRQEHVIFFKSVIIPLHKVQTCSQFYEQLLRCSMLFLTKDRDLAVPLLEGLLKYWPFANAVKETLFLTELQEVLEVCEVKNIQHLIPKLFKRITMSIQGDHLQVADRAMCFFENDYFLNILRTYKEQTFPMLVPVITDLAKNHWHKILQDSLIALETILKEIDKTQFDQALALKGEEAKAFRVNQRKEEREAFEERWGQIESQVSKKDAKFSAPTLPFHQDVLIRDYNEVYFKVYEKVKAIDI